MNKLRILSLLPAATEIVYLLGLEKYLVGVSHECDYPTEAKKKPKVTFSEVTNAMSSREIDKRVKNLVHRGPGVFHIKEGVFKKLRPNLILTQELCEVCAIGFNQVRQAARILDSDIKIISLEPESVDDILENIRVVGEVGEKEKEAIRIVRELKRRLKIYDLRLKNVRRKPRVLVIEWLDPIMVAGHWIPEMVNLAGGINLINKPGQRSKAIKVNQIKASKLDILIISPCGFDIERTRKEKPLIDRIVREVREAIPAGRQVRVELIDGNAYMTRPGPRVVDGIEQLYAIIKKHANS